MMQSIKIFVEMMISCYCLGTEYRNIKFYYGTLYLFCTVLVCFLQLLWNAVPETKK